MWKENTPVFVEAVHLRMGGRAAWRAHHCVACDRCSWRGAARAQDHPTKRIAVGKQRPVRPQVHDRISQKGGRESFFVRIRRKRLPIPLFWNFLCDCLVRATRPSEKGQPRHSIFHTSCFAADVVQAFRLHGGGRLPETTPRALIADGDQPTERLLSQHLVSDGFTIDECVDGREALERLRASPFDLIVLDATLPGLDGIALCRAIRQGRSNPQAAIFVVAGSDSRVRQGARVRQRRRRLPDEAVRHSRVSGARLGGHAESRAGGRAAARDDASSTPIFDSIHRDGKSSCAGQAIACSKQEFDLLYALASSPGIVFSREELLARTGRSQRPQRRAARRSHRQPAAPQDRTNGRHSPQMILTVWGIGYKFSDDRSQRVRLR